MLPNDPVCGMNTRTLRSVAASAAGARVRPPRVRPLVRRSTPEDTGRTGVRIYGVHRRQGSCTFARVRGLHDHCPHAPPKPPCGPEFHPPPAPPAFHAPQPPPPLMSPPIAPPPMLVPYPLTIPIAPPPMPI